MSDDSVPLVLPLLRFATGSCEATTLYRELRKPLLRYLVCLGLSATKRRTSFRMPSLACNATWLRAARKRTFAAGCFASRIIRPEIARIAIDRRFGEPLDDGMDSIADQATPEQAVLEKEKFSRLGKAIRLLTESERECLLLRAGGLRYREIGEVLGIPTSTVGDTVDRAIKKLAEKCNV